MIQYSTGQWSISFLFTIEGSVFPKAIVWAIPAGINAAVLHWLWFEKKVLPEWDAGTGVGAVWSSFNFVLGFLLVFRTQSAYSRYWEGATLVQQARASFFNATSSLIAFCSGDSAKKKEVEQFQHLLVRLMSMLHCVGLQTVAEMSDVKFEFFNTEGMDYNSLKFLSLNTDKHQRCEIVVQWIQRLIVDNDKAKVLDVPPPILTRVFQELAQGTSYIINARIMTGIPFPFPYAQLLTTLLLIHSVLTPFFSAVVMRSPLWSSSFSFISVFAFWGVNYIAAEIEAPFGDDPNDLPLHALQKDMNKSLWILLHPSTQAVPTFRFDPETHRKWDIVCKQNFHKMDTMTRGILMTGRSRIWAQRLSALTQGSRGDLGQIVSDLPDPTPSAKSSTGSTFFRSKTAQTVRSSVGSGVVDEVGSQCNGGDAGWDELPVTEEDITGSFMVSKFAAESIPEVPDDDEDPSGSVTFAPFRRDRAVENSVDVLQEFLERYVAHTVQELLRLQQDITREGRRNPSSRPGTPSKANTLHSLVGRAYNSSSSTSKSQDTISSEIFGLPERIGSIPPTVQVKVSRNILAESPNQRSKCNKVTSPRQHGLEPPEASTKVPEELIAN